MLNQKLPTTLQFQLKNILLQQIRSGFWKPGDKIDSEREVCQKYNVSRITVREVIKELEQEGYVIKKQGKGTYVKKEKFEQKLGTLYNFSDDIVKKGHKSASKIISIETYQAEEKIKKILELPNYNQNIYHIKRLRLIDDEIFAYENSYIPCYLVPKMEKESIENDGLYNTINRESGLMVDEAEEAFEAINSSRDVASYLEIEDFEAILKLTRLAKAEGKCIEYCKSMIRGDRYKYRISLG